MTNHARTYMVTQTNVGITITLHGKSHKRIVYMKILGEYLGLENGAHGDLETNHLMYMYMYIYTYRTPFN